ncbi:GFA family protein [[Limnothrix rosea] IAM M-220]|uniref:GFA family protein n=1 Tax=[Limnothrix rosea] IAM M-220 TaxID=454133 RepID=UPI000963A9DD|nr:GFA family protein [[Limnothrix rosea] IAM M-220]OKH18421.1 aldehyde-activating protein [[Limnothrix rosea] IAM M-220]
MTKINQTSIYHGGCHCGAVRFRVQVKKRKGVDCNCSICSKKGFLHLIVPKADFELLQGKDFLTIYQFNTKQARHTFCRRCGVHSFYYPRSHPDGVDVNLRCLDGMVLDQFQIEPFDGQNWEDNITQIT